MGKKFESLQKWDQRRLVPERKRIFIAMMCSMNAITSHREKERLLSAHILDFLKKNKFRLKKDFAELTMWSSLKIACEKTGFKFLRLRHMDEIKDNLDKVEKESKRLQKFLDEKGFKINAPGGN